MRCQIWQSDIASGRKLHNDMFTVQESCSLKIEDQTGREVEVPKEQNLLVRKSYLDLLPKVLKEMRVQKPYHVNTFL